MGQYHTATCGFIRLHAVARSAQLPAGFEITTHLRLLRTSRSNAKSPLLAARQAPQEAARTSGNFSAIVPSRA